VWCRVVMRNGRATGECGCRESVAMFGLNRVVPDAMTGAVGLVTWSVRCHVIFCLTSISQLGCDLRQWAVARHYWSPYHAFGAA
jgi:hypothetical protein